MSQVIAGLAWNAFNTLRRGESENGRDTGSFHESISGRDPVHAMFELDNSNAFRVRDSGNVCGNNREDDHLIVKNLVVLQMMQQHDGRILGVGCEEYCGPPYPLRRMATNLLQE